MDRERMKAAAERMTFESIESRLDFQESQELRFMHEEQEAVRRGDHAAAARANVQRGKCLARHLVLLQIRDTKREMELPGFGWSDELAVRKGKGES